MALLILATLCLIVCSTARSRMAAVCSSHEPPRSELHCGQRNLHQADSLKRFLVSHPWAGTYSDRQRLYRDARWLRRYALGKIGEARGRMQPSVDSCTRELVGREGGWNPHKWNGGYVGPWEPGNNHGGSGAYGAPQALPGNKMRTAGPDWRDNIWTQIKWMLGYEREHYGSPCAALAFQKANGWY